MGGKASTLKLKLDINGKCGENSGTECKCTKRPPGIIANKELDTPVKGFIMVTHKDRNRGTFTLDGQLQDGTKIGSGSSISGVKEVSVFYWNKNENTPLLIGIQQQITYPVRTGLLYVRD